MPDEERSAAQTVSDVLTEAVFKAKNARGVIVAIATEVGSILTMGAGDFVTKLGLYKGLEEKAKELWNMADEWDEE